MEYLQRINPLYYDVLIRDGNIKETFLSIGSDLSEGDNNFEVGSDHELKSVANHLRAHRQAANESLVVKNENLLELAPGQDNKNGISV